jgi:tight adherence protein C
MTLALVWMRWLCVGVLSGAIALLCYAVLCAPSRPAARLGIRGLMRQRALADTLWRAVEPIVRWLGVRLSGVLSEGQTARLDRQLRLAGDFRGLTPPEYVALSVLTFLLGILAGLGAARITQMGVILVLACALLGLALPYMVISGEAEKRLKSIGRRLPGAIDLIALAMSAGLDFPGAIRQVVERSSDPFEPLTEELGWILHKLGLGTTRRQALAEFAERVPIAVVIEFVGAVVQAEERGHPVSRVLQVQAGMSRQRRSVQAEEAAARARVALAGPLLLLFLAILLLIIAPMVLRLGHSGIFGG